MKIAAILTLLIGVTAPLSAQGPSSTGLKQQAANAALPRVHEKSSASLSIAVAPARTKHGAILGGMAGLMTGIVFATVAGPVGDSADTPGGAVKVVALSIAAGIALGALIGSMIH